MLRSRWPVLLLALPVLAACTATGGSASSGTSGGSAGTTSPATTASGSSSGSRTASTGAGSWGHRAGCPSVGKQIPPGTNTAQTVDVDGDGRPDTEWIAQGPDAQGRVPFGVRTASGAVISSAIPSTGSPVPRSVMFADVTGSGEIIALASDGRQVPLFAVSDCQLIAEQNQQGRQYTFDLGFTGYGTGVGCADADGDGVRELLGLKLNTDAGTVERTIIELQGPQARNGATSSVPVTSDQDRQLATSVTCGQLTMAANGVRSNP